MLTNQEVQKKYLEYLREVGVNSNIIQYFEKNPHIIREKLKDIIGEDLYSMYKDENIRKLREGSNTFKITEDGNIWWKNEKLNDINMQGYDSTVKISGTTHHFAHAQNLLADPNKQSTTELHYITYQDNHIIHKEIDIENCKKDNENYYNGTLIEKKFDNQLNVEEINSATWKQNESPTIPNKELLVCKQISGKGDFKDFVEKRENYNVNFSQDMEWQFVANGRTQGERLQEEIGEITKSFNILIDGVRNFFDRLRNHTKDIEK